MKKYLISTPADSPTCLHVRNHMNGALPDCTASAAAFCLMSDGKWTANLIAADYRVFCSFRDFERFILCNVFDPNSMLRSAQQLKREHNKHSSRKSNLHGRGSNKQQPADLTSTLTNFRQFIISLWRLCTTSISNYSAWISARWISPSR